MAAAAWIHESAEYSRGLKAGGGGGLKPVFFCQQQSGEAVFWLAVDILAGLREQVRKLPHLRTFGISGRIIYTQIKAVVW